VTIFFPNRLDDHHVILLDWIAHVPKEFPVLMDVLPVKWHAFGMLGITTWSF
jgi:hypothetical protein